jgi:mRNA-degrading endonuclease toxin of MazEF toxin-antitoxin module
VRPAVVISSNQANRSLPTVTVAAITTRIRAGSPLQMVLPAGKPTPEDSAVLGFQVMTMDQSRLDDYLGALDDAQLVELAALLRRVWGL